MFRVFVYRRGSCYSSIYLKWSRIPSIAPSKQFLVVDVKTLKKVIPLGLVCFCILFNYTILGDTKDMLAVTSKGSGA